MTPNAQSFKGDVAKYLDESEQILSEARRQFIMGPMWADCEEIFSKYSNIEQACEFARLDQGAPGPVVYRRLKDYCGVQMDNPCGRNGED